MKPPTRRTGTLLVLAFLLAAISTGSLTICDALIYGDPSAGDPIIVSLKAGEEASEIAASGDFLFRFGVCPSNSLPAGTYLRTNLDTRGLGSVSVDLVTTTDTPPGHYPLTYVASEASIYTGAELFVGVLDLTVLPPDHTLVPCLYVYAKGEALLVNQPITFYSCSQAPETNPIVQYKWWFNYNSNPNSTPDMTTTAPTDHVNHTYSTAGPKSVRLVVRAQNGDEAITGKIIMVQGL